MKMLTLLGIFIFSFSALAMNGKTTYQAKIIKPDGYPLEATSVNFRFTVLDTSGSCALYVEDYAAVNMSGSGGLISFALGSGTRSFPTSGTSMTFRNIFENVGPFPCRAPNLTVGSYGPGVDDARKIVMQFQDSLGWQTLPAMSINAVPYAMYAHKSNSSLDSGQLNGKTDAAFVEYSTLASLSCNPATHAITFNGVSFSCIAVGGGGGGGITSVTTSGTVLSTGGTASAPVISITAATMSQDGYLTSLDYAEFKAKLSASSTQIVNTLGYAPVSSSAVATQINNSNLSGDVSGTISSNSVITVGGKTAALVSTSVDDTLAATASNTADTIVKRNSSGNFTANDIYSNSAKINYVDIYKPSTSFNIRLQAPTSLAANYTLMLPTSSGTSGQVLSTDGSGNLSWVNPSTGSVTSVSATAPLSSTGGSTPTISISQATSSTNGYLSSSDFTTFNNKQNATSAAIIATLGYTPADNAASGTYVVKSSNLSDLTNIVTARSNLGLGTFATASSIDLGSASATGIIADARLADQSNVSSGTQYTKVTVDGKGRVVSAAQLSSSDVTTALGYTPATSTTLAASFVQKAGDTMTGALNLPSNGLAVGTSQLVVSGSNVGIGVVNPSSALQLQAGTTSNAPLKFTSGTLLSSAQSGTIEYDGSQLYFTDGSSIRRALATNSAAGSFDNTSAISNSSGNITLSPNNITGSVIVNSSAASISSGTGALVVNGGVGIAGSINAGGNLNLTGSATIGQSLSLSSMTSGSLLFAGASGLVSEDNSRLFWDGANKRLGLGTNSPAQTLSVSGTGYFSGNVGIGISNPTYKLQVSGGAIVATGAGGYYQVGSDLTDSNLGKVSFHGTSRNWADQFYTGLTYNNSSGWMALGGGTSLNLFLDSGSSINYGSHVFRKVGWNGANRTFTEMMRLDVNGNLGVGTASPNSKLDIYTTGMVGATSAVVNMAVNSFDNLGSDPTLLNLSTPTAGTPRGNILKAGNGTSNFIISNNPNANGSTAFTSITRGGYTKFAPGGTGSESGMLAIGVSSSMYFDGDTPVVGAGVNLNITGWSGSTPSYRSVYGVPVKISAANPSASSTAFYADVSGALNNWAFYAANGNSYFGASVGIGISNPTAKLHMAAGTSAVAPLKFTSGTLLSSPQSGTMEYDGINYYVTDGVGVRHTIAMGLSANTIDNASNINSTGNIVMTPNNGASSVIVSSTVASISSNTGALVVNGGLGIAGAINAGGSITTSANLQGVSVTATSGVISPYIYGSTASGGTLTLDSTTHATKGNILLAPTGGNVGIGTMTPAYKLSVYDGAGSVVHNIESGNNGSAAYTRITGKTSGGVTRTVGTGLNISDSNGNYELYDFTAGASRMYVNNSGNIGIGTTSPSYKLDINEGNARISSSNSSYTALMIANTVSGHSLTYYDAINGDFVGGDYGYVGQNNSGFMEYNIGSASPMPYHVFSGGNVGIGTTAPIAKLHLADNVATNIILDGSLNTQGAPGYATRKSRGTTASPTAVLQEDYIGTFGARGYGSTGYSAQTKGLIGIKATENWTDLAQGAAIVFETTAVSSTTRSEKMRIDSSGNVGIGTNSPTSPLDVTVTDTSSGIILTNTNSTVSRYPIIGAVNYAGSTTGHPVLSMSNSLGTSAAPVAINSGMNLGTLLWSGRITASQTMQGARIDAIAEANFGVNTAPTRLTFSVAPSSGSYVQRMVINSNGNVGIGTTTPANTLDVSGTLSALKITGTLMSVDNRAVVDTPETSSSAGMLLNFKNNSANSLNDGGLYNGVVTFRPYGNATDWSGGPSHQIGFTTNGNLFHRYGSNTTWNTWRRIIETDASGRVGIGTTAPTAKLDVSGTINIASGSALTFGGTNVCTAAGCTSTSDARLKENIRPLDFSLEKLLSLNAVEYDWKNKAKYGDQHQIGFLAQDLEKVYPEVVYTDKNTGLKSVTYGQLIAPLLEGLKALYKRLLGHEEYVDRQIAAIVESKADKAEIEELRKDNVELKQKAAKVDKLESENAALKAYLCSKDPAATICK